MHYHRILGSVLLLCLGLTASITTAQPPTIITVAASEWQGDLFEDTIIPAFEAEHPNIQVEFVYSDNIYFGNPMYQPEDEESTYYDDLTTYAESADVLYVSDTSLSPYAINTGFFLDLTPLVSVDDAINEADFYPAAWQTFQWDGGVWALPYSMEVQVLVYDRSVFDAAGLPYPDQSWRLQDYILSAEQLHTYNANGEVEFSALNPVNPTLIVYSEVGPLFDTTTFPTQPDFSNPEFQRQIEAYVTYFDSYEFADFRGYSFNDVPMTISYPYQLSNNNFSSDGDKDWAVSLLSGDTAGSRVEGFAISSGTAFPEASYEFVSFMTENIDVFSYGASGRPARRYLSLDELDDDDTFYIRPSFDPEVQSVLDQAYEVAIPANNLWFSEAFYRARSATEDGVDIQQILEDQRIEMIEAIEEAQTYQSTQLTVAAPTLPPDLVEGEIALQFGMNTQRVGNVREELWILAIDEFVAQHPTVGVVDIKYQIYGPSGRDEDIACWYDGYGGGISNLAEPPEDILALNPLLSADPNFDPNSFLPGVLESMQVNDLVYGYPMTVQPITMWVNRDKFAEAGLPIPETGWTTNDFASALVALGEIRSDSSDPVLRNNLFQPMWLNMLIASFGGQLIDNGTVPPTYTFTSPETISAIQQIAGYIDDGLIQYDGLVGNNSSFFIGMPEDEVILIDILGDSNFNLVNEDLSGEDYPLQAVTFPDGIYMPVTYSAGTAFIASDTPHVQECYDFISMLAQQPELFTGMPSRPMLFNDPDLITQQGEEFTTLYETFGNYFTAPNIMVFPSQYSLSVSNEQGAWLEPNFFYMALDNAILNDADLEAELIQAEENIGLYRECVAGIDVLSQSDITAMWERSQDEGIAYQRQFTDCAITLAPELQQQYSFYYQQDED